MKARKKLYLKLKDIFRKNNSQPINAIVKKINPILRGWVNYFRIGNSAKCFAQLKDWVNKKIRRHLMRAKKRRGFGWKRWSNDWIYEKLGLFADYEIRRPNSESVYNQ